MDTTKQQIPPKESFTVPKPSADQAAYRPTVLYGLLAAALMAIYLWLLQAVGLGDNTALKFMKYIILFVIFGMVAKTWRDHFQDGLIFNRGILYGGILSVTAGLGLVLLNFLAFVINPELAFSKFGDYPENLGEMLYLSGTLFMEVLIFGMIINFIWLQYYKTPKTYDK